MSRTSKILVSFIALVLAGLLVEPRSLAFRSVTDERTAVYPRGCGLISISVIARAGGIDCITGLDVATNFAEDSLSDLVIL
jgi:hypothetical protein